MPHREQYVRKLPHIQPLNGTFFVTYRLHGTLPNEVGNQLQQELADERERLKREGRDSGEALDILNRRYFGRYDSLLDTTLYGPTYLNLDAIAHLVADSLHHWDGTRIELIAYVIMANHVHAVFTLSGSLTESGMGNSLNTLMQSIKGYTGHKANQGLSLTGRFWEQESYDRLVRDDAELIRIIRYVLNNPVKAGLCQNWRDWKWSYVKADYDMF